MPHALLNVTFLPPDRRHYDIDNLVARIKAGIDGIADATGINDREFHLAAPIKGEPVKGGAVIVEISPVSAGPSTAAQGVAPSAHPPSPEGPTQAVYNPPSEMIAMGFPVPKGGAK